MKLSAQEIQFLRILSDGRTKTYVKIVKGFGQPLTPMVPTFTNRIAKRLLKLKLVKRGGSLARRLQNHRQRPCRTKKLNRVSNPMI